MRKRMNKRNIKHIIIKLIKRQRIPKKKRKKKKRRIKKRVIMDWLK